MSTRQIKQIMQVASRVIIMIVALYGAHTMLACGGSGGASSINDPGDGDGDGGDDSDTSISVPAGYGLYGTIDGLNISLLTSRTESEITVEDHNANDLTDSGDSMGIGVGNYQAASQGNWAEAGYHVYIGIDEEEMSDISQINTGTIYTLTNTDNCFALITTENQESQTYYDCQEVRIIFNAYTMPEEGGITRGDFEVVLQNDEGELVGSFSDVPDFEHYTAD